MEKVKFSTLDLLELPRIEREIFLHISRQGVVNTQKIAQSLGLEPGETQSALLSLLDQGRIREVESGKYEVVLGQVIRRTILPVRFWPALLAADRLYSEQEIATLRTVVPMLQFARARLSEFTDHGPGHAFRVKSFATQLGYLLNMNTTDRHLLRAGALFHDIGNVVDRAKHNIISQETVVKLTKLGKLPFTMQEAELIGMLCRWHRGEFDPERVGVLRKQKIAIGHLASTLRVADAMDIDHRRSDYGEKFRDVLNFFFPEAIPHWISADEILGVRIHCAPVVNLQVFTRSQVADNLQIRMLREDLASTPLNWSVQEISVEHVNMSSTFSSSDRGKRTEDRRALLVFPFEAHSMIMAGLSYKHLLANNYAVEFLCYPDSPDGPAWLWYESLHEFDPHKFDHVIILGDRPDPSITPQLINTIRQWQTSGTRISILNRYEANWSRLPQLRELGVELILGGDWAYFWGMNASESDFVWARIAALCTRDPTQSIVGMTARELAVSQGILNFLFSIIIQHSKRESPNWSVLAERFLERVVSNDMDYFANQAEGFSEMYLQPIIPGKLDNRVVVFDNSPGRIPQTNYWVLESEIEKYGRAPVRIIQFNVPYALAVWPDGEFLELLAINHWRDETVIPIRLLYPIDLGAAPEGNECTVRIRLPAEQAEIIVKNLLAACNQARSDILGL